MNVVNKMFRLFFLVVGILLCGLIYFVWIIVYMLVFFSLKLYINYEIIM